MYLAPLRLPCNLAMQEPRLPLQKLEQEIIISPAIAIWATKDAQKFLLPHLAVCTDLPRASMQDAAIAVSELTGLASSAPAALQLGSSSTKSAQGHLRCHEAIGLLCTTLLMAAVCLQQMKVIRRPRQKRRWHRSSAAMQLQLPAVWQLPRMCRSGPPSMRRRLMGPGSARAASVICTCRAPC